MIKDKRKSRRRQMHYTAWMLLGPHQRQGCVIHDISEAGARLDVEDSDKLPERFFLLLSLRGPVRRVCQVVWRKPTQLGVKFERSSPKAERKSFRPTWPTVAAEPERVS